MTEKRGFVGALFDFSFSAFVATRVIKVLYGLSLILIFFAFSGGMSLGAMMLVMGLQDPTWGGGGWMPIVTGVAAIVLTPIVCVGAIIYARLLFEGTIIFFRMAEHLSEINAKTRG